MAKWTTPKAAPDAVEKKPVRVDLDPAVHKAYERRRPIWKSAWRSSRERSSRGSSVSRRSETQMATKTIAPGGMGRLRETTLDRYARRQPPATLRTMNLVREVFSALQDGLGINHVRDLERADIFDRFDRFNERRGLKKSTCRTRRGALRAIIKGGRDDGLVRSTFGLPQTPDPRSPKWRKEFPRSELTLPPPQNRIRRLREYLETGATTWEGGRLHALVSIIALTGIPLAAALRLRVPDIDLAGGFLTARSRSNGEARRVPPPSRAQGHIEEMAQASELRVGHPGCNPDVPVVRDVEPVHPKPAGGAQGRLQGRPLRTDQLCPAPPQFLRQRPGDAPRHRGRSHGNPARPRHSRPVSRRLR